MPKITITKIAPLFDSVRISDEDKDGKVSEQVALKGVETDVSDSFVKRLEAEFPEVEFEVAGASAPASPDVPQSSQVQNLAGKGPSA